MVGVYTPTNAGAPMDTATFLKRVLPESGYYASANLTDQGMMHGWFSTVDDLAQSVQRISQRGGNAYYAVAAFQEKGKRNQDNARVLKSMILDIDCGADKPYPSWREGLKELSNFISVMALPKPMIVFSGNGLHVYWVLTEELGPDQWKPLGLALKAACAAHGLEIDPTVPADSARVLRPTDTINPKGGNTVRLLIDAQPVDPDVMRAKLAGYVPEVSLLNSRRTRTSVLAQALAVEQEFPEANANVVASKCQQIEWGITNQKDVSEPFWYAMLGIAAYCADSEAAAVAWSSQHPDYEHARTLRKMEHWKQSVSGPATCKKFKEERSKGCANCKFADKITTPVQIGAQYQAVEITESAPDKVGAAVPLPRSYKRTTSGIKQTVDGTDIDICPFDIYPVGYGRDEALGYETVRYHWNRKHVGWQELTLRQAYLTDSRIREFVTAVADQGIVLKTARQTEMFQFMMRSYMDKLREMRAMTNLHNSMGWKDNYTQFVHGNTIVRRMDDGSVVRESVTLGSTSSRLGGELFCSAGSAQPLSDLTAVLDRGQMYGHMFALGVSLSAPLLAFTGLNGVTVSLYGPSGTGKTLAQLLAQAVWGDPQKLHFAAKFTQNSLYNRLGLYSNMPMTIDEVTIANEKEVGEFLYMVTQGRDKARLNRNSEERETKTWALPLMVSTNTPLSAKLELMGSAADAQKMRLLEVMFDVHPIFSAGSNAGRKMFQLVTENYGHIGPKFVEYLLAMGPTAIKAMIEEATVTFSKRYNADFSGEERFWETTIVLADLAMRIAREQGWFKFDHAVATRWVLEQTGTIRLNIAANKMDAFDILSEYINSNTAMAATVMHTSGQRPVPLIDRIPRAEVRIRFDIYRRTPNSVFDHGTVMVDRTHFRRWLASGNVDYRSLMRAFEHENIVVPIKNDKAYLGKDTPIKLGQSYVTALNLNHPRLKGILDEADQAYDSLLLGQMQVVSDQ
jgi:hypothetical protein